MTDQLTTDQVESLARAIESLAEAQEKLRVAGMTNDRDIAKEIIGRLLRVLLSATTPKKEMEPPKAGGVE